LLGRRSEDQLQFIINWSGQLRLELFIEYTILGNHCKNFEECSDTSYQNYHILKVTLPFNPNCSQNYRGHKITHVDGRTCNHISDFGRRGIVEGDREMTKWLQRRLLVFRGTGGSVMVVVMVPLQIG